MQQLTFIAPTVLEWREVPAPLIEDPRAAIVRPIAVATCDIDTIICSGRGPFEGPFPFGHECVAEVVEIGADVRTVAVGQRVVVSFQISCGECVRCLRGRTGDCQAVPRLSTYGLGKLGGVRWGGFLADLALVPFADAMLVPLPDGVDPQAVASASDNIPDGYRTVAPQLRDNPGAPVLVVGGGAAGIPFYAIDFALALGAERVDYIDTNKHSLELAERMGAKVTEGPPPRRAGRYPITVDACADPAGLACAIRSTEPGGFCTSIGVYYQNEVPLPLLEMYTSGITFHTGRVHARPVIPEILALAAEGRIHPERVTGSVVTFADAAAALAHHNTKLVFVRQ